MKGRLSRLLGTSGPEVIYLVERIIEHQVDVLTDGDWFDEKIDERVRKAMKENGTT